MPPSTSGGGGAERRASRVFEIFGGFFTFTRAKMRESSAPAVASGQLFRAVRRSMRRCFYPLSFTKTSRRRDRLMLCLTILDQRENILSRPLSLPLREGREGLTCAGNRAKPPKTTLPSHSRTRGDLREREGGGEQPNSVVTLLFLAYVP